MKIKVKTVKGEQYEIEVEGTDKVRLAPPPRARSPPSPLSRGAARALLRAPSASLLSPSARRWLPRMVLPTGRARARRSLR
jgi:hypothetical protein